MTTPVPATAADLAAAREAEYGQYVATQAIDIGTARAFNVGDAVPVSHVEAGTVRPDQVAKTSTKAGREAAGITDDMKKG